MQKLVQIEGVSLDELLDKMRAVITPANASPAQASPAMITVLNKKNAAKTLNIGESLFTKLHARGIIPATVLDGENNKGKPIYRWAQHHLIAIKPVITQLRHKQSEEEYISAKQTIQQLLGA